MTQWCYSQTVLKKLGSSFRLRVIKMDAFSSSLYWGQGDKPGSAVHTVACYVKHTVAGKALSEKHLARWLSVFLEVEEM